MDDSTIYLIKTSDNKKSTTYKISSAFRARDETRTRDPQLGRLTLYQLSYSRILSG